jgi:hypothetical protein
MTTAIILIIMSIPVIFGASIGASAKRRKR